MWFLLETFYLICFCIWLTSLFGHYGTIDFLSVTFDFIWWVELANVGTSSRSRCRESPVFVLVCQSLSWLLTCYCYLYYIHALPIVITVCSFGDINLLAVLLGNMLTLHSYLFFPPNFKLIVLVNMIEANFSFDGSWASRDNNRATKLPFSKLFLQMSDWLFSLQN